MAKAKTVGGAPKKAKAKTAKTKAKSVNGKSKTKSKAKGKSGAKGLDALLKLAEHPMVSDLLAIGAMAAVAAIADKTGAKKNSSSQAVKTAGKAAAAAIGARLLSEYEATKKPKATAKKPAVKKATAKA